MARPAGPSAPTTRARLPLRSKPSTGLSDMGSGMASGLQRQYWLEAPGRGATGEAATVQCYRLTAHVAGAVGDEQDGERADLVGLADPPDRDELAALGLEGAFFVVLGR